MYYTHFHNLWGLDLLLKSRLHQLMPSGDKQLSCTGTEFVMCHTLFHNLRRLDPLLESGSHHQLMPLGYKQLFGWFKLTLKLPNSMACGNLWSAIWYTSHWNFLSNLEFGHINFEICQFLVRIPDLFEYFSKNGCLWKIEFFLMKEWQVFQVMADSYLGGLVVMTLTWNAREWGLIPHWCTWIFRSVRTHCYIYLV